MTGINKHFFKIHKIFVIKLNALKILKPSRSSWVAQSIKRPITGYGSGHDLIVHGFEPHIGLCADGVNPAWDSFSLPFLSAPIQLVCPLALSLSLSLSK